MKTVKEVAALSGVTARTLRYYHQIGLLTPARVTQAGYRLYDEADLERLQQILVLREVDLPLEEIRAILEDPRFDRRQALERHRQLLQMKRDRLDGLLRLVDETLKGGIPVRFQEFDMGEIKAAKAQYAQEAEERWGDTDAYRESVKRTGAYQPGDWAQITSQMEEIFQGMADAMAEGPDSPRAQALVVRWQEYITQRFYPCTDEILAGLGELYVSDPRFAKNLDRYAPGMARFFSQAIACHCGATP